MTIVRIKSDEFASSGTMHLSINGSRPSCTRLTVKVPTLTYSGLPHRRHSLQPSRRRDAWPGPAAKQPVCPPLPDILGEWPGRPVQTAITPAQ